MTDETAKALVDAMNRLAAAIENLPRSNGLGQGISVYHQHLGGHSPTAPSQYFTRDHWPNTSI